MRVVRGAVVVMWGAGAVGASPWGLKSGCRRRGDNACARETRPLLRVHRRDDGQVDDGIDVGPALQHVDRGGHADENRADGLGAASWLNSL